MMMTSFRSAQCGSSFLHVRKPHVKKPKCSSIVALARARTVSLSFTLENKKYAAKEKMANAVERVRYFLRWYIFSQAKGLKLKRYKPIPQ